MKKAYFCALLAVALSQAPFAAAQAPAKPAAPALPTKEPAKATAGAPKPAATGPLATVNGVPIPRQRADLVVRQQVARGAQDNEQLRAQIRELLINNELIAQEAAKAGFGKRPEVQLQLDLNRNEIIANAFIAEFVRTNPVADADIQKEYERAKTQTGTTEYRARHILVASEDEAKKLIAEIAKGAKFEDLAQKSSMDEGTRPRGGDLDWNVPSTFDKAFADAMVKLEKGTLTSAPVRTRFGFHIIRLEDVRPVSFPPLQQVRPQIQQRLAQQRVENLVRDLRGKAKVE